MVQNRWWNLREIIRRVHANSDTDSDGDQQPSTSYQPHNANTTAVSTPLNPGSDQSAVPLFIEPGTVLQTPRTVTAMVNAALDRFAVERDRRLTELGRDVTMRPGHAGQQPLMTRDEYERWWDGQSHRVYETFLSTVNVQLTNTHTMVHRYEAMELERDAERARTREAREKIASLKLKLARERMHWGHSMRQKERDHNLQLVEKDKTITILKTKIKSMERLEDELMNCLNRLAVLSVDTKEGTEDGPSTSGSTLHVNTRVGTKRGPDQTEGPSSSKSPRFHEDKKE